MDRLQKSLRDQFLNILSSSGENVNISIENVIFCAKQQQYFRKKWSRFATGALFILIHLDKAIKFVAFSGVISLCWASKQPFSCSPSSKEEKVKKV